MKTYRVRATANEIEEMCNADFRRDGLHPEWTHRFVVTKGGRVFVVFEKV